ncbi:MAG: hypothetical protein WC556_00455 [Candidatus Methanoperedens sp.]
MDDRKEIFGSEHQNPRVSAQSAASAFPFRFDEYYFINPNKQNFNSPQSSQITQSLDAFSLRSSMEKNKQRTQRTRNELTLPEFVLVRTSSLFVSCSFMNDSSWLSLRRDLESKNLIENRCDDE